MNLFNEIKAFIKSASYAGKAFNAHSKNNYQKALEYYEIVIENTKKDSHPLIYMDIAKTLNKLKRNDEALINAQKKFDIYSEY